jgi:HEPN domain-containing protein
MSKQAKLLNYQVWFLGARSCLKAAKALLKQHDEELLANAICHAQWSAEKALRAYLVFKKQPIGKKYDLKALLDECIALEQGFATFSEKVVPLASCADEFQYPGERLLPEKDEVVKAIEAAEQILEYVRKRITYESHPNLKLFTWLLMFLGWKGGW